MLFRMFRTCNYYQISYCCELYISEVMSFVLSYGPVFYLLHFNLSFSRIYVSIMFRVQLEVLQWDAERVYV